MKTLLIWLAGALIFGPSLSAAASTQAPTLVGTYGIPVPFNAGILQYEDFNVWLASKSELVTTEGRTPWTVWKFEVRDRANRTIGGDITFNREARANGRRFDVQGKIYVAEMFSSTAESSSPPGSTGPASRLESDQIVIWDEASAAKHNPRLSPIWKNERIDPESRWSSKNAYADGILLPGFSPSNDAASRLVPGTLNQENVGLIRRNSDFTPVAPLAANYGLRKFYFAGTLLYPDFIFQFSAREELHSLPNETPAVQYEFSVYDLQGRLATHVGFSTYNLANGRTFQVGGKIYFAELFFTTGGVEGSPANGTFLPLRDGEVIVWDEATSRIGNPKILSGWKTNDPETRGSEAFAAGKPLSRHAFTGNLMWGADDWLGISRLDDSLKAIHAARIVYPAALAGSGFIGHVSGIIFIKRDGTVDHASANSGNNPLFQEPVNTALKQWRFSIPTKDGRPVQAALGFDWEIAEPEPGPPQLRQN